MGSSSSKQNAKVESSSLQMRHSVNDETQISDSPSEQNDKTVSRSSEMKSGCCQVSDKCFRTDSADQSDDMNCTTSDTECGESSFIDNVHRESNTSSRHFASRSLNPCSRFISRFSFYPRNLSFRLKKANSLDSTRADSSSSTSYTIWNEEENHAINSTSFVNNNNRPQGCDFSPTCFSSRSLRMRHENRASNDFVSSPDIFDSLQQSRQISSGNNVVMDTNVRFSRTMSVGRLRDRVLRRMHVADSDLYNFQREREVRLTGRVNGTVEDTPYNANFHQPDSSDNFPSYGRQNYTHETPRGRETRHHDLLENRSNFIERRRRIRSQVRALQRLGSRFENLPSHERSCTLSIQHRQGQCTCRAAARDANPNDNTTAGASISRIVMLAEALFEVLDEIHQQSVVLSSRSSVSSVGLIPAPNEVVDSLPLKIFSSLKKKPSEEATQCYICLLEYEEGDSIRILPCHHEFHRVCVDKWLKEVHRICPCCRRDICKPELSIEGS